MEEDYYYYEYDPSQDDISFKNEEAKIKKNFKTILKKANTILILQIESRSRPEHKKIF